MKYLFLILFFFAPLNFTYAKPIPSSFADLVEGLTPAVVSIASTTILEDQNQNQIPQFPEGSPLEDFFKDFYGQQNRGNKKPLVGLGSGFIIDDSGIVVTNNHVIENADEIKIILSDKVEFTAKLLGRDPKADLAVLKFDPKDKKLQTVKWGNSDETRVGDWAIAIGNPYALGGTVTAGIVSAISRDLSGSYVKFIQTDASINRGNSGGPLFDLDGRVIGINTSILSETGGSIGLGFAIPSNSAKKIVYQLEKFGKTRRGWLGVEITFVTQEIAESLGLDGQRGAFVSNLNPNGPAKKAGIQEGDIILKFNGVQISQMSDLPRLVGETDIGTLAVVEVWRKNILKEIEVELGELPEKSYVKKTTSQEDKNSFKDIPLLGISIESALKNQGVKVVKVQENTSLLIGDIITEVNREKVSTIENFSALISEIHKTGRNSLLLKILRNNESQWTTIKFK